MKRTLDQFVTRAPRRLHRHFGIPAIPFCMARAEVLPPAGKQGLLVDGSGAMAEGEGDQAPSLGIEVPFNVGISDSEIDFSNPDERERWLQTQPAEVAWVIAARAALRAVPGLSLARRSTS